MSDSAKICALGIVCVVICMLVKKYRPEFSVPVRLASTAAIFGVLPLLLSPILRHVEALAGQAVSLEYFELIIKALSISYLTQISGEICRDCGEGAIASGIETVGKAEIIILSLPLIDKIISLSKELMTW